MGPGAATTLLISSMQALHKKTRDLTSLMSTLKMTPVIGSWSLLILVVSVALLARLHSPGYIAESLWHEDGNLFINESYSLGLKALWTPTIFYQSLYQRLVAFFAAQAPLTMTPYLYFLGWALSFFAVLVVIKSRARFIGLNNVSVLFLMALVALQPSHGEAWFDLTHANFFLGIALSFYICMPAQRRESILEILFLLLASLTGPFSLFLTAVLAVELVALRDFLMRKATYIIVPACALVQALFILASKRVEHTGANTNIGDWLQAFGTFFVFGKNSVEIIVTAVVFWLVTLVYFIKWTLNKKIRSNRTAWLSPMFGAAIAASMFLAGALSEGKALFELNPLDMQSRYFLIPYSLSFFVAVVCTMYSKFAQAAVVCSAAVICALTFLPVDRADRESTTGLLAHTNMQWSAFVRFQKIRPNLEIPLNSPDPMYPPSWSVQIVNSEGNAWTARDALKAPILLTSQIDNAMIEVPEMESAGQNVRSLPKAPVLYFDVAKYCIKETYLAVEIDVQRARMGMTKLAWGRGKASLDDKEKSLERFYPAGLVTMQFAFHRELTDNTIRLYPALGVAPSTVVRTFSKWKAYMKDLGITDERVLAEPTEPGGDVRISEVRLFCLE